MDSRESRFDAPFGIGQDRQQWGLRARKFEIFDKKRADVQFPEGEIVRRGSQIRGGRISIAQNDYASLFVGRKGAAGHNRNREKSGAGKAKKLERNPKKATFARVYDIINAGPRNRFTVSGKLVHNCGYQGGVGAFQTMAKGYGVKIGEQHDLLRDQAPEHYRRASDNFNSWGKKSGIAKRTWLSAETVKLGWRDAHPNIVQFWRDLESVAIEAIESPGKVIRCGSVRFARRGSFLFTRLPSGRQLCYPYPEAVEKETPFGKKTVIKYKGVDSYTRKWQDCFAYGGLISENDTSAVARDCMVNGMWNLEKAGYPIVFTVHDEIVSEHKEGFGSVEEFCALMVKPADWMAGLPIAAAGWRGKCYRKG